MTTGPLPGFYGKVPALGDFVSRRLCRGYIEPWDAWLQSCLACSREQLGEHWLEIYLTSPMWRFVLSPGACGEQAWAGALMPSVDRVGRYFPLTVAMACGRRHAALQTIAAGDDWFQQAETALLSALEDDSFEIEAFDARVAALGAEMPLVEPRDTILSAPGSGAPWRVALQSAASAGERLPDLLAAMLAAAYGRYSIWWTTGSELLRPSLLICTGLPPAAQFAALLAGDWQSHGWHNSSIEPPASEDAAANGDAV